MSNLSWQEYCEWPAMNASTLVHGLHSMKRLRRVIDSGGDEETDAMRTGTAIHSMLLEPERFAEQFVTMPAFETYPENLRKAKRKDEPEADRRTTSKATEFYKQAVAKFERDNAQRTVLTSVQMQTCQKCRDAIRARKHIADLVDRCEKEVALFGEIDGVPFKCRVDLLDRERGIVADLKTTMNCEKYAFGRKFMQLHYDVRLAIYRNIVEQNIGKLPDVMLITQETAGDFDTALVPVPAIVLDNAWTRVIQTLAKYKQCLDTGHWPGVDGGLDEYELVVPNWAMQDDVDWDELEKPTQDALYF